MVKYAVGVHCLGLLHRGSEVLSSLRKRCQSLASLLLWHVSMLSYETFWSDLSSNRLVRLLRGGIDVTIVWSRLGRSGALRVERSWRGVWGFLVPRGLGFWRLL